jgi:hypothetical protein
MADNTARPLIIKRKKVIAGGGHHGGAWKVAIHVPFLRLSWRRFGAVQIRGLQRPGDMPF